MLQDKRLVFGHGNHPKTGREFPTGHRIQPLNGNVAIIPRVETVLAFIDT